MSEIRYISIEGVIGAGKTSLAKKLAEKLEANFIAEEFETNPFLKSFYEDRKRYAFQTQMFFLICLFATGAIVGAHGAMGNIAAALLYLVGGLAVIGLVSPKVMQKNSQS